MSHRVRLKGVLKNRGTHRNKPAEHRLPWEEKVTVSRVAKAAEKADK